MHRGVHRKRQPNVAFVATHGGAEPSGPALLESHVAKPVAGWDVEVVNGLALLLGRRYFRYNMAATYGTANHQSRQYELRRSAEVLELAEHRRWALDVHDRPGLGLNDRRRQAAIVARLRTAMDALARDDVPKVNPLDFTYYEFVTEILHNEARWRGLDYTGPLLEPLTDEMVGQLNLKPGTYVNDYWNGNYNSNPAEYFGGVLRKVPCPFFVPATAATG